jgi:hypothetical protein
MDLMQESVDGELNAMMLPKKLYTRQYELFAKVRVCDAYHNFTPALKAALSPEEISASVKRRMESSAKAEQGRREARISALNDVECAVRFLMAAQMVPDGPARQAMNSRVGAPAGKFSAGGGKEDVFRTNLQRSFTEHAQAFQRQDYKVAELIEDVGVCEKKYDLPPSGLKVN